MPVHTCRVASLTSRGKAVAGLAFLMSAVLCAGAAAALVRVSDREPSDGTAAPRPQPTLIFGSTSPTPSPTASATAKATASPSPVVTVSPSASPRASATATSSPRPRTTTSPRSDDVEGLAVSALLSPAQGDIFVDDLITMKVHATDGKGTIALLSLEWGDGAVDTSQTTAAGKKCAATSGGDCRDFTFTHRYDRSSPEGAPFTIVLRMTSTDESAKPITFKITIYDRAGPSPTPTSSP